MAGVGLISSPFHRRLLLILALVGLGLAILSARLATLSLARGGQLRAQAESVLLRERWVPAARGKILDRKGRVLAQDRPTYNVLVQYATLARLPIDPLDPSKDTRTPWARAQATRWAKRLSGSRWLDLTAADRAERVASLVPAFEEHLAKGWEELARLSGVTREELDRHCEEITRKTETTHDLFVEWRLAKAIEELRASGQKLSPEQRQAIAKFERLEELDAAERRLVAGKQAEKPIAEQEGEHVILSGVSDEIGFACMMLEQAEGEVLLPAFDAGDGDDQFTSIAVPKFPGLLVEDAGQREYPYESVTVELDKGTFPGPLRSIGKQIVRVEGVACHILGRMRDTVYKEDAEVRQKYLSEQKNAAYAARAYLDPSIERPVDRGAYRRRDRVGAAGLEFSQEQRLRPLRGVQMRRIDTGELTDIAPEDGQDLHLTLDIALQAKVQAIMAPEIGLAKVQPWQGEHSPTQRPGDALHGAAVVIDIDSAEILAMVSTPTFTREQLRNDPGSVYSDEDPETLVSMPGVNKAIGKAYVPGSIVKAILLADAESRGVIAPGHCIDCTGHLFPNEPNKYRCWIYKMTQKQGNPTNHTIQFGHHPSGPESLMVSCNIYFFTLGRMLGPQGIMRAYRDFGVESRYNLGVGYEWPGQLGRAPGRNSRTGDRLLNTFDAIQMGIGQGPVTWTPVHAADAYATLARGGVRVPPKLIRNDPQRDPVDLGLKSEAVAEAIQGLRLSTGDPRGTGHHVIYETGREDIFDAPGVTVWGKTGTATASPIKYDPDGEGPAAPETLEEGDHSWFVVLAGNGRPQYAISVVIDFGGSGGKVSGPIVNQIIHALQAEGYLEGGAKESGGGKARVNEATSPQASR